MRHLGLCILALFSASCLAVKPPSPQVIINKNVGVMTWDSPVLKEDRTTLEPDEIAGSVVFWGRLDDDGDASVDNVGLSNVWESPELELGIWQFWIWTVDVDGVESELSEEVRLTVVAPPSRPAATTANVSLQ